MANGFPGTITTSSQGLLKLLSVILTSDARLRGDSTRLTRLRHSAHVANDELPNTSVGKSDSKSSNRSPMYCKLICCTICRPRLSAFATGWYCNANFSRRRLKIVCSVQMTEEFDGALCDEESSDGF